MENNNDFLNTLGPALLHLHKALLDYQKNEYEAANKKVSSPAEYFELVTKHPDFAWLHAISELIVSIDEIVDSKEESVEKNKSLIQYASSLFTPTGDTAFAKKYAE